MDPILALILPFMTPVFSKLFASCGATASGQTTDPKAELRANQAADGSFNPDFVRRMRPHTKKSMRRSNRGKHRTDPSFVPVNPESVDEQTEAFFNHVLEAPDQAVKAGFAAGQADFIGSDADMDE